jgi:hypothetical protein
MFAISFKDFRCGLEEEVLKGPREGQPSLFTAIKWLYQMSVEDEVEELKHKVEALEQLVRSILSKVPEVRIECSVPKIVYERKYEYVKVSEDELYGRIIRLALDGFFDEWRSASDVAKELLRRGWAPKDFKHVRPALEHLVALEVLERERKPGRKAKWLFRKAKNFEERVVITEGDEGIHSTTS